MNVLVKTKELLPLVSFPVKPSGHDDTTKTATDYETETSSLDSSSSFLEATRVELGLTQPQSCNDMISPEQDSQSSSASSSSSRCDPIDKKEEGDIPSGSLEVQPRHQEANAQQLEAVAAELQEPVSSRTFSSSLSSTSTSLSSSEKKKSRAVRFGQAVLHEHAIIPGDNPSCMYGIPITIDWECRSTTVVDSIALDQQRPQRRQASSKVDRLCLSAVDREELLIGSGYSQRQLLRLDQQAEKARAQYFETMETTSKKFRPLRRILKGTKKRVRDLLSSGKSRQQGTSATEIIWH